MNVYLIVSGTLSLIAAILHIGCIYFGSSWYRFFGAGERMALMAEQGSFQPVFITSGIVLVLTIWSLYAFSAAGLIFRLPLLRIVLTLITSIYIVRGVVGFMLINSTMEQGPAFWFWSSSVCLVVGVFHAVGVKKHWATI